MRETWRVGRKVGHHIYAQIGAQPADDDPWLGSFRNPEDAEMAVEAMNLAEKLLGIDRALTAVVDYFDTVEGCAGVANQTLLKLLDRVCEAMPKPGDPS
ncbi:MAG TPA: hypothetical protein VIQ30_24350 [Pseudonocardia sp.]